MLSTIFAIVGKDLAAEWRTKEALSTMLIFSVLVIVTFSFAFNPAAEETRKIGSGILWIAFIFSGILGLNRSFALEKEQGCLGALMLAPVDRGAIYIGKLISNCLFMLVMELFILPIFAILFNFPLHTVILPLILICFLGTLGFTAVGTILAAVSANTRMREVLLPVLLLPVAVPVLIWSVEATNSILDPEASDAFAVCRNMLIGYNVIFIVSSYLLFEYILED
jgi:heme exporter protein B